MVASVCHIMEEASKYSIYILSFYKVIAYLKAHYVVWVKILQWSENIVLDLHCAADEKQSVYSDQ